MDTEGLTEKVNALHHREAFKGWLKTRNTREEEKAWNIRIVASEEKQFICSRRRTAEGRKEKRERRRVTFCLVKGWKRKSLAARQKSVLGVPHETADVCCHYGNEFDHKDQPIVRARVALGERRSRLGIKKWTYCFGIRESNGTSSFNLILHAQFKVNKITS